MQFSSCLSRFPNRAHFLCLFDSLQAEAQVNGLRVVEGQLSKSQNLNSQLQSQNLQMQVTISNLQKDLDDARGKSASVAAADIKLRALEDQAAQLQVSTASLLRYFVSARFARFFCLRTGGWAIANTVQG